MDITDVLQRCIDSGVRLTPADGELRVHFDGQVPDAALLALLKQHKEGLLRHLRTVPPGSPAVIPRLPPAARARVPASAAQRRMWLIDRFEKASTPYNMVGAFRLLGALDPDALAAAVDAVVARHEALRTNFVDVDGELLQVVHEPFPVAWERLDASGLEPEEQDRRLQDLLRHENQWRFDLAADALIRATTLRLSGDVVVFVLNVHHIACDGWSIEILKREISAAYAAIVQGRPLGWTPPPVQYPDYSEWQSSHADDVGLAAQLEYWTRKLDALPQLHGLPLDKPRPALQTYTGRQVHRTFPAQTLERINAYCQARDATLFMFMQMAFTALVSLYSGERDVAVGFPMAGRRHRDADSTVGLFVNTAILRCQVDGDASFNALLDAAKQNIREAFSNQDVPYEVLIERLKPGRSRAHSPLVQLLLTVQNQVEADFALAGLEVERLANVEEPVKFDLQVVIEERAGQLGITWQFNSDLFEVQTIDRMADGFSRLIDLATRDGDARLYSLTGSTAPLDGPAAISSACRLEALITEQARAHPDRPAVAFEATQLTYRELEARASALAVQLRAIGVGPGALVGLCVDRSIEMVVGILGVLKAGAAYVPLDMSYPAQRLAAMISDCDAPVLLSQRRFEAALNEFSRPVLFLDEAASWTNEAVSAQAPPQSVSASDPAYVIYTSGTTGVPKGVVVPHANVVNLLAHFDCVAPLAGPWNGSLWSSINFDVSVYEIFSSLCAGGCLHIVPEALRLDPERLFGWMAERDIHSTYLYAGYLEPFGEYLAGTGASSALRRMLVGVEPISSDHLNAIARHVPGLQIVNGYGPTEATVCCTTLRFQPSPQSPARRVPIGRAVAGALLHVMNPGGEPALPGALGELYVGGAGLAIGYLNRPELTRERFVEKRIGTTTQRLYRTGDLVRCLPSGDLEFVGRVDEQIKVRGFRIEPGEIEVRLCQQPEVSDAAVVAMGEGAGKRIVAFVVPRAGIAAAQGVEGAALVDRIKRELKGFLPDYMIPADIVLLERIPMTANGKVDRAALPRPVQPDAADRVAPRDDVERRLLAIWKEVLGLEEIGVPEEFFALGGHSLHVTRLTSRVRQQFQISESDISLDIVFEHPTVEALAQVVAAAIRREDARAKEQYLASLGESVEEGVF